MKSVVALLEVMWGPRRMERGPRWFEINPHNYSGKRLLSLLPTGVKLRVTNACPQMVTSAKERGTPDPTWVSRNLHDIRALGHMDLLLVCGNVARDTYYKTERNIDVDTIYMKHPAARWHRVDLKIAKDTICDMLLRMRTMSSQLVVTL